MSPSDVFFFAGWTNEKSQHHPEAALSVGGSSSSVALLPRKLVTHSTSDSSKSYHLNHIFSSISSQSTGLVLFPKVKFID